ncbi:MAG TPA: sigma-70 family RNA polymerase sigma factor, partial [Myxococcota bacterium]|nr:sigma-70 family RNA polymerase sigma factor [Myxococcota bacterium]
MEAEAIVVHYPAMVGEHPEDRSERAGDASPEVDPGAELIARHLRGEPQAFAELVAMYRAPVFGFLVRGGLAEDVADDVFQDTFLRVHQHARQFSPERSFRVWLFTIAHNLVRSHHRKRFVRRILV